MIPSVVAEAPVAVGGARTDHGPSRSRGWWWIIVALAAVGFTARLTYDLRHGGPVYVRGYDPGVYYAAADSLIHGRLPYRGFLFLETPGIAVVLTPFALLGTVTRDAVGYGAANVFFTVIGAANTALIGVALRRFGPAAAIFGGVWYAVTTVVVASEQFIKLEPVATLLILVALVLLEAPVQAAPSRTITAGVLLGLSCGFKIWYVVPALVILVTLPDRGRRWRLLGGGAVGAVGLMSPFFLAAPATMFREVVLDQLGRGRSGVSIGARLHGILGDVTVPAAVTHATDVTGTDVTVILFVLAAAAALVAVRVRSARRYVWLLLSGTTVLLAAPSYFAYYTSLTSAPLALVLGVAFGRVTTLLPSRHVRAVVTASMVAATVVLNAPGQWAAQAVAAPTAAFRRAVAAVPGCVVSDNPQMLAATDVLSPDLARGCDVWPDVTGWTYDVDSGMHDGRYVPRAGNLPWQHRVTRYLTSGAAVIPYRSETRLDAASKRIVTDGTVLAHDGPWRLYATAHQR